MWVGPAGSGNLVIGQQDVSVSVFVYDEKSFSQHHFKKFFFLGFIDENSSYQFDWDKVHVS